MLLVGEKEELMTMLPNKSPEPTPVGAAIADGDSWTVTPQPSDWTEHVNLPQTEADLEAVRQCLRRGSPYGNTTWTEQTAKQLGLQSTLRRSGRPHKEHP